MRIRDVLADAIGAVLLFLLAYALVFLAFLFGPL